MESAVVNQKPNRNWLLVEEKRGQKDAIKEVNTTKQHTHDLFTIL